MGAWPDLRLTRRCPMNGNEVSLARAIRGPVTLITLGVLFALNNFTPYRFHQTWPILLIVFGLLTLLRRSVEPAPPVGPVGYAPPAAPYNYPPGTSAVSYRQTPYAEPAPPVKGGFGTSAPGTPTRSDESS